MEGSSWRSGRAGVWTSADGATWTAATLPMGVRTSFSAVAYQAGFGFLVAGLDAVASSDGVTWRQVDGIGTGRIEALAPLD